MHSSAKTTTVGVITYHHVPNYGAFLQAWAMVQALRQIGCRVEVVDYRPQAAIDYYRKRDDASRFKWPRRYQTLRFVRFNLKHLPLSPRCDTHDDLRRVTARYDVLVSGSDQIWKIDGFRGFDEAYFLECVANEAVRRVAYAPSCGDLGSFEQHGSRLRALLANYAQLSARDASTLQLIQELGFDAQRVVDPTLLVDFSPLQRSAPGLPPYLVLYGAPPWAEASIQQYAQQRSLKIISLGGLSRIADRSYPFVLPDRWLGLIAGAQGVVTSAFHGVMFSLVYKRPFATLPASGKEAKITDALSAYGHSHRLITDRDACLPALEAALQEECKVTPEQRECIDTSWHYLRSAIAAKD